jgi:3-isopropylmalate dehydrogenase
VGTASAPKSRQPPSRSSPPRASPSTTTEFDLGAARYLRDGFVLDDATLDELRGYDAILLGAIGPAIGDTRIAGGVLERGLLLRMRFGLDLYINYRPFRGVEGSLAEGCEFAIVRENTEGPLRR